jgi:signal transduction histidine kinase
MKLRTRIALALAACFVVAGAVVLAVSAVTYQRAVVDTPAQQADKILSRLGANREQAIAYVREHPEAVFGERPVGGTAGAKTVNDAFEAVQRESQNEAVRNARVWSAVALAVMAVAAGIFGWLIAGRALRPLRRITARAREASAADLDARVALDGPHDEIRELGDTFDEMLARLQQSFVAQRRFSAQVSHELRTPLAVVAGEAELLLLDPRPQDVHSLRQIQDATDRAAAIVSALLVLGRSGAGDLALEHLDLDRIAGDVLGDLVNGPRWRELRVDLELDPAPVLVDRVLVERLLANLFANAADHNRPGGFVAVRTARDGEWSVLEVTNSVGEGPRAGGGHGIGLTIVDAVLAAHGGELTADEPEAGVRRVRVRIPVPVGVPDGLTAALPGPS